jgi:hypothetical protein
MTSIARYSKAIAAAAGSFAGAFGAAISDGNVTVAEWIGIATAVVVATVAVFAAPPNAVQDGEGESA